MSASIPVRPPARRRRRDRLALDLPAGPLQVGQVTVAGAAAGSGNDQQDRAAPWRPADWPGDAAIDLAVQDLPHASSTLEWWYVNAHLETASGRQLSLFASFFRTVVGRDEQTGEDQHAHALTWALVDPAREQYLSESLVDQDAPAIARRQLEHSADATDPLLRRALLEVLGRGQVPRPDLLLTSPCLVATDHLLLDFDGRCLESLDGGAYRLELANSGGRTACRLEFHLAKPVQRHGHDGLVSGRSAETMFYYFVPRCALQGTVTIDGVAERIVRGSAWYDHEFGYSSQARPADTDGQPAATAATPGVSWDWIGAQLDNGWDLTIYSMVDDATDESCGRYAVMVDPSGRPRRYDAFMFEGYSPWTSSRTFATYPTAWSIVVPDAGLTLAVQAAFPAQEVITMISRPSFWEGRVAVEGLHQGTAVTGRGFVERRGFNHSDSIPGFFGAVSRATYQSVEALLPKRLTESSAARLVASPERPDYLDGLDLEQVARALIHPVRTIVDRGGKAWRSYILLACCDAVGGDSQPLLGWLALPELMHVGSLIVDDVEDGSLVRRGGPAAHVLYGTPLAINAGSACYFLPQLFLRAATLSDAGKLRIYELYMEAVRAAHTGQALDLDGFAGEMPRVVEDGAGDAQRRRVRAVHRLKSAAPASCLAQVGALLGGGTESQIQALGAFVEQLGVAFQIVDDVLNLTGFENDLKARAEDLAEGKVTMPVAVAMTLLERRDRRRLWDILDAKPREPGLIREAIDLIEGCGALGACRAEAEALIESGWHAADPLLPDSRAKLMLRAFGWYVLERQY
jgi:geranylgeranyl pyrophosphate synthase/predicted secreted hydrolase